MRPDHVDRIMKQLEKDRMWGSLSRMTAREGMTLVNYIQDLEKVPEPTTADDLALHGVAYTVDGKRIDPARVGRLVYTQRPS